LTVKNGEGKKDDAGAYDEKHRRGLWPEHDEVGRLMRDRKRGRGKRVGGQEVFLFTEDLAKLL
jgi:hypothetical protein